jgi:hypothetical protein
MIRIDVRRNLDEVSPLNTDLYLECTMLIGVARQYAKKLKQDAFQSDLAGRASIVVAPNPIKLRERQNETGDLVHDGSDDVGG